MSWTTRLGVVVWVCAAAASGAAQGTESGAPEVIPVADGIYRVALPTAWVPQHATVSVGEDGVLLVDPGGQKDVAAIEALLERLGGGERRIVVDTHGHADHTSGNGIWGGRAVVVAHSMAREELTTGNAVLLELPSHALPTITFDDELTIFFNGERVRLKHLPGGHSASDIAVIFEGSGVVALGGMVYGGGFPGIGVREGGTPEQLADDLQWVLDNVPADATVITGHGTILTMQELAGYVAMLRTTTALVVDALTQGKDAEAIKKAGLLSKWAGFARPYLDVDGWVNLIIASRNPPEPDPRQSLVEPLYQVLQTGDASEAIKLYRKLKETAAEEYAFTEGALNAIGYYLLGKDRVDEALAVLKLNVEEYPQAFNPYDSLGEAYMIRGDRELAIQSYRRSLDLNPGNTNAEGRLAELTSSP